jgi:hypothetical protein
MGVMVVVGVMRQDKKPGYAGLCCLLGWAIQPKG